MYKSNKQKKYAILDKILWFLKLRTEALGGFELVICGSQPLRYFNH